MYLLKSTQLLLSINTSEIFLLYTNLFQCIINFIYKCINTYLISSHESLTTLSSFLRRQVDDDSSSRFAYGSDFRFGGDNNSPVYIGGVPVEFKASDQLNHLALPSASFKSHLRGAIRNMVYSNCSCNPVRVDQPIGGNGYSRSEDDNSCGPSTQCAPGCLCMAKSPFEHECDCQRLKCTQGLKGQCCSFTLCNLIVSYLYHLILPLYYPFIYLLFTF